MTSLGTAVRLPFVGDDLVAPLATDLSAWQLMQLGWVYSGRTGRALHCRLGGDPATVGGESVILGTEDNVATVAMFTGPLGTACRRRAACRTRPAAWSASRARESYAVPSSFESARRARASRSWPSRPSRGGRRSASFAALRSRGRSRSSRSPSP